MKILRKYFCIQLAYDQLSLNHPADKYKPNMIDPLYFAVYWFMIHFIWKKVWGENCILVHAAAERHDISLSIYSIQKCENVIQILSKLLISNHRPHTKRWFKSTKL